MLRSREGEQLATRVELFFDLVFVFAITQLSALLAPDISVAGAARVHVLLLVVWWAWIHTTWMTNWCDPTHLSVRLVLIVCMGDVPDGDRHPRTWSLSMRDRSPRLA